MTRILIADDNPQNLYLLESILKGHHFEVVSTKNGAEALNAALSNPPDLIVADILMPVMDGFELCRRWKADERLKQIPFIFYTATYTDEKDERFAMNLGADRFVVKPQKPEVLNQIISELLAEHSRGRPLDKPSPDETALLQQYNEVLFRKLEKKVKQLEDEIVDRKRAGENLLLSETRYRRLFESMMDAFARVDMSGHVLECNKSFKEMLGYSDEELARLTYQDLTPEKWHALETDIVRTQILPLGYSTVYEKEYRKKDGTLFPVELRTFLIRDDSGQPSGMWAIVRDISQRKRSEERILLANHKLALMTEVTYQDIQNKVTALRGFAELSRNPTNEEGRIAHIEKQMEILESIQNLIKKTKDYQQMGIDRSRWIGIEETIRLQMSLQSQTHTLSLLCDLSGLELYTDPLLAHVFYNLIHNAIRHGGNVSRITFSAQENPSGLLLVCEDDGVGIPSGEKTHLFDRVVGGSGKFGLFFVREFLILSGMTIRETGIPGRGARFEITVPAGMYRFAGNR
jgi:PAS domain S-box-containing protein